MSSKELGEMLKSVKEFATIKHVLERNSRIIKVRNDLKVKSLDCKVLSVMLNDILRHNTVLKMEDEDFIFIRRAYNVKSLRQKELEQKNRSRFDEPDHIEKHLGHTVDSEDEEKSQESIKRLKTVFKKLLFLNMKRMLDILKSQPT